MKIGYRDYIQDATITDLGAGGGGEFVAASLENIKTRQLAVKAITIGPPGPMVGDCWLNFDWDEDVTVRLIAILAHNMYTVGASDIGLQGFSGAGGTGSTIFTTSGSQFWEPPVNSQFPRNTFFDLGSDKVIRSLQLLYKGTTVSGGSLEIGRLWAGPVWSPEEVPGTGRRAFRVQPRDDSVLDKSDGQQAYADVKPRYRQLTCTLPWLTEAEAIGTEDGATQNLQDISFEVGKALPITVIPDDRNNQLVHKFGVYGTFADPPPVDLIEDSSGTEETGLAYSTQFDVIEEL